MKLRTLGIKILLIAFAALALPVAAEETLPAPEITRLQIEPASLTMHHARDAQQFLVFGFTADGVRYDMTDAATISAADDVVTIEADRYISPARAGATQLQIQAAGLEANLPVEVKSLQKQPLEFIRDIEPILSKVGCNAGTCHGAQKGKNGFMLSLRGYDPQFDYYALVEELQGRRINRVDASQSYLLLKAISAVPHEGKQVFTRDSRAYELIHEWIEGGLSFDAAPEAARPVRLQVIPESIELDRPGRTQRIIVLAHYADGTVRDVTRDAVLSSNKTETATVEGSKISAIRRGEAAVLVRYEGQFGVAAIGVMGDRRGFAWDAMPENNFIDKLVNAKLAARQILPSEPCTDAEFARRVYLDLTGVPPTAAQARAFVEDVRSSDIKRENLIDELIRSESYVAFWSNKWADLLQCNSEKLGEDGVWRFREWIRQSIASNKPYDQFVHQLITARGSSIENPATGYLLSLGKDVQRINNQRVVNLANVDTGKITEDVSQTFLGVRFNCNKCHDHPFERWTQNQYYQFGAYFAQLRFKDGPRKNIEEVVVYTSFNGGEIQHPKTNKTVLPKVPYGQDAVEEQQRREKFAHWMTSADNPLFAKSYVNRMWSYFFGIGIIDPVDDIRASNPASNPELLDRLTKEFIDSGFDTEQLIRTILHSQTYQRSFRANNWNRDDGVNFSHYYPRRLSAEQLLDAVALSTGTSPNVGGNVPQNMRSVFAPDGQVAGNDFLKLFGRPNRESACECERTNNISLAHALNLVNGPVISDAVVAPNSAIQKLIEREPSNAKAIDELFYMILARPATLEEIEALDLGEGDQRLVIAQDLSWALLNSPAFLFNR